MLSLDRAREPRCPTSTQEDGTELHCRPDVVVVLRATMPYRAGLRCHRKQNNSRRVLSHPKFLLVAWVTAGRMLTFVIYVVIISPLVLNISVLYIGGKVIRVGPHQCWIELSTGGDVKRPQGNARRCRIPDELPASDRSFEPIFQAWQDCLRISWLRIGLDFLLQFSSASDALSETRLTYHSCFLSRYRWLPCRWRWRHPPRV